jgi:hypothetical protein
MLGRVLSAADITRVAGKQRIVSAKVNAGRRRRVRWGDIMEWGGSGRRGGWRNGNDGCGMKVGETNLRFGPVFVRSARGHGHGEAKMAKPAAQQREQI